MLSLEDIREKLKSGLDKISINVTLLTQFKEDYSKVRISLNKADAYNPANYCYLLPYQQSNLPKGTTAKINRYITRYVCHMTLAKDFFSTIYASVQDDLDELPSLINNIESAMNERIRIAESRNNYLCTTYCCAVEIEVLSQVKMIRSLYEQLKLDFSDLCLWMLEFLYKDFEQFKKEQENKSYFSRIYMRLAPNAGHDDLVQFNEICKRILQKYLVSETSTAQQSNDKLSMRHITDLDQDNVALLLQDIATETDKIVYDKENARPSQQVSGLVVNISNRNVV